MENYPEFLVAHLNYPGCHAGHQIEIVVAKNEIWSPSHPSDHFSRQNVEYNANEQ